MDVPIEVRVEDIDSETFTMTVRNQSIPVGSTLYGANGVVLVPNANGDYVLTAADVDAFLYQAPLHWSDVSFVVVASPIHRVLYCMLYLIVSQFSGDIRLAMYVTVVDTTPQGKNSTLQTPDYL
jgi:hypothetical protein